MSDEAKRDELGLAGKVAIVTGAGAADDGIGNGRAAAFASTASRPGRSIRRWYTRGK
jgi:hypothetical protein